MTSRATLPRPSAHRLPPAAPSSTEELLRQRDLLPRDDDRRAALRTRAIEANLALAGRLARRYAGRGEALEDLAQVAAVALIKAVDGYDPSRAIPFLGYAIPSIVGSLKRHFRDAGWAMRVPRSTQDIVLQVRSGSADLSHRHGGQPTPGEVAQHLGVPVAGVRAAMLAGQAYRLDSLDAMRDRSNDGPSATLERVLGVVEPGYAALDDRLMMRALVSAMPARERRILTLRFYDQMTQSGIATEIGVSQMHVSRLLKQALTQLRIHMLATETRTPTAVTR